MEDSKILELMAERMNEIRSDVGEIKVTMATNTASLEQHIRRTEAAEANIEMLRAQVKPIADSYMRLDGAMRMLGYIAAACGAIFAVVEFIIKIISMVKGI